MGALRIGVIVNDPALVPSLRSVIMNAGLEMGVALEFPRGHGQVSDRDVDAWVVNLDIELLETTHPEALDALMDSIQVPMILCEGKIPNQVSAEFGNWQSRLVDKLKGLTASINRSQHGSLQLPRSVWVLAGSIGGPESVKQFMDALPGDLGIAFIYANHLQRDFQSTLTQVVGRNASYKSYAPQHGDLLHENSIAVISPDYITGVTRDGSFIVVNKTWEGQYKPNLDQVVANTAKHFGHAGGVIVFSGMCDDAATACRLMRRCGGQVWTQSRDTCVSWAMPDATERALGSVDFTGSPVELAARLAVWAKANVSSVQ
jgi:chemosensory pili system protein ChpB (putative protein-glutamate methylesterase)